MTMGRNLAAQGVLALALSIDNGPYKQPIIAITYFVVVFSIIVQGLTIGKVANRVLSKEEI